MKTKILSILGVFLLFFSSNILCQEVANKNVSQQKETFSISCTPDLYSLALQWANAYAVHPCYEKLCSVIYEKLCSVIYRLQWSKKELFARICITGSML
jgi:hypothetical protein